MELCDKELCTGCGACVNVCPKSCISLKYDEDGFLYPQVETNLCISCQQCNKVCPSLNRTDNQNSIPEKAIGCQILDQNILRKSSSGGAFYAIAQTVMEAGGVVFGCSMNTDLKPCHKEARTTEDISAFHGSKYLQSNTGYTYKEVKNHLKNGQLVLYVGCPCQIAGLYAMLGNADTTNLLTVDLVCHGVGSQKLFEIEVAAWEQKHGKKIIDYGFRSKDRWSKGHHLCKIVFSDHIRYIRSVNDPYMGCFLHAANYRENCYHCLYAQFPRIGDMTIGDYVGIDKTCLPKGMFKKGMSVLLLNNEKATKWFDSICKRLWYTERPLEESIATNKNLVQPCNRPKTRDLLHEANTLEDDIFKRCRFSLKAKLGMMAGDKVTGIYKKLKSCIKE